MKTRKMLASLILVALASAGLQSVAAAATEEQQQAMQMKIEEFRERLALTPEQEAQIAPLMQARNEKLKSLRASSDPNTSRREKRAMLKQARGIQQEFIEQVDPLITPEQKKEWDAMRKEMRDKAIEHWKSNR